MANRAPRLPPTAAKRSSRISGTRQAPRLAQNLS